MLLLQLVAERLLPLDHLQRQRASDTEKNKESPLPPERTNEDQKHKPEDQLRVGEEVKGARRRELFQEAGEVDPGLHPSLARPRQGIGQEHEQKARVDANVHVTDCPNSVHVRAIVRAEVGVLGWEDLEVPVGRTVARLECIVWQEGE